jgi:hypothetical protein
MAAYAPRGPLPAQRSRASKAVFCASISDDDGIAGLDSA